MEPGGLMSHSQGLFNNTYLSQINSVPRIDTYFFRINLPLFSTIVPSKIKENKGKLILTEIFPSVQKHDIFYYW